VHREVPPPHAGREVGSDPRATFPATRTGASPPRAAGAPAWEAPALRRRKRKPGLDRAGAGSGDSRSACSFACVRAHPPAVPHVGELAPGGALETRRGAGAGPGGAGELRGASAVVVGAAAGAAGSEVAVSSDRGGSERAPRRQQDHPIILHQVWERVLLTEMSLPRIARLGTVCLTKFNKRMGSNNSNLRLGLDEDFQPYHPPFRYLERSRTSEQASPLQ